jgi:hypothetical protein
MCNSGLALYDEKAVDDEIVDDILNDYYLALAFLNKN